MSFFQVLTDKVSSKIRLPSEEITTQSSMAMSDPPLHMSAIKRPRVLHIAHGIPSYNNSLVEMARRLVAADIDLYVACHVVLSEVLQESPAKFIELRADTDIMNLHTEALQKINGCNKAVRAWKRVVLNRKYKLISLGLTEIADHIKSIEPDLLLIDMECHVAIVQTLNCKISTVLCSRWFSVFKARGIPPMHTIMQPAKNPFQLCHVALAWQKLRIYKLGLDLKLRLSRRRFWPINYNSNGRFDLESLARQQGVKLSRHTDRSHWLIPHIYSDYPVMSLTMKELEFGEKGDERMHYVGPMIGAGNTINTQFPAAESKLHTFIERNNQSIKKPLIYCSFSTFWSTETENYQALSRLFFKRPDLDFVIGLGGNEVPDALADLPENALTMQFAPQIEILKFATIAITHGGISTINESLYHGVPLIVCSSGHVDQNGCAARVAYHGAGVVANSKPLSEDEIERLIDQLLDYETVETSGKNCHPETLQQRVSVLSNRMREMQAQGTAELFIKSQIG